MRRLFLSLLVLAGLCGGAAWWWLHQPLALTAESLDLSIEPGTSARGVAQAAVDAGVQTAPVLLYAWFRASGNARQIKAGSYEIGSGTTPISLLSKLVRGDEALRAVTLVEGWNFRQVRAALAKAEQLKPDSTTLGDNSIMAALGRPGVAPEGRFFPDTYTYSKGSSDFAVLKRAMHAMDKKLAAAWALRQPTSQAHTPDEALTLASIVEKETGQASDRAMVSGVFNNRLRVGMPLQTDPTVIYGLGESFDGNLRKRDLQTDSPYNTYLRPGLPPTPIAMPGTQALLAAVQPAPTSALYFVARGDGSSQFSSSLEEHNRAVNKYQRKQ
ncbi:endolytic transglycosylase MltG [Rhodoferax sp.]|uniref:endolytic transglycosylase MltG n=1 Tax=Rhodoferax sp. TaxID=50421 RepID=UPI00374D7ADE